MTLEKRAYVAMFNRLPVLAFICAILFGLSACSETVTEAPGEEVDFQTLTSSFDTVVQGQYGSYDFEEEEYIVIDNQDDFEAFWEALHEGRDSTPSLPTVDFSQETVVAAVFGTKSTGGHTIDVTRVSSDGGQLHVQVEKGVPGDDCLTTQAVTSPYHVIKVPATGADFEFNASEETHSCD